MPTYQTVLAAITGLVGVAVIVLVSIWSGGYRGGVAWQATNKNLIFNWHPILMLSGLVVLGGAGALTYKILPASKQTRKITHATINGIALILAIIGVVAAFRYHNESVPPIDNLYSLHSWIGLITIILFALQWVFGLLAFLFPGLSLPKRQVSLPWHSFFGAFLLILSVASAELGILEKITFLQASKVVGHYSGEAVLANWLGLSVLLYGALVIFTATWADKATLKDGYDVLE